MSSDFSDDYESNGSLNIDDEFHRKCKLREERNYNDVGDKLDFSHKKDRKGKEKDKSDRETRNGVMDRRSRRIICKLLTQQYFSNVEGCISTGKEASVFRAVRSDGDLVLKVYGTSIMKFKTRSAYMEGDFRLRNATLNSSTKLVCMWAEKEHRNLLRICKTKGAIPCPTPLLQKSMVLLMTMIGNYGLAAPKLKDVEFETIDKWNELYKQVVSMTRILFQECRLVHADLSEYNLLYFEDKVWMIDVSQSVEHEHKKALFFLKRDCNTVNNFFRRKGVKTLLLKEYYDFVVDLNFGSHLDADYDEKLNKVISETKFPVGLEVENCFLNCYIPRNLGDVDTFYEDYKKALKNPAHVDDILYASVTGMTERLKSVRATKQEEKKQFRKQLQMKSAAIDESEDTKEDEEDEIEEENIKKNKLSNARPKNETAEEKKARKNTVKEDQKQMKMKKKDQQIIWKMKNVRGFKKKKLNFEE